MVNLRGGFNQPVASDKPTTKPPVNKPTTPPSKPIASSGGITVNDTNCTVPGLNMNRLKSDMAKVKNAAMVVVDNCVVYSKGDANKAVPISTMGTSITTLVAATLPQRGVSLDTKIHSNGATLKNFMNMTSGYVHNGPDYKPRDKHWYNEMANNYLGQQMQKNYFGNKAPNQVIFEQLLKPMGGKTAPPVTKDWLNMFMNIRDLARIGQILTNEGKSLGGKQLITTQVSGGLLTDPLKGTTPLKSGGGSNNKVWSHEMSLSQYAYGWWPIGKWGGGRGFFAGAKNGRRILTIPDYNTVVVGIENVPYSQSHTAHDYRDLIHKSVPKNARSQGVKVTADKGPDKLTLPGVNPIPNDLTAKVKQSFDKINKGRAIIVRINGKEVYVSGNVNESVTMASVGKSLAAIVAAKQKKLDQKVPGSNATYRQFTNMTSGFLGAVSGHCNNGTSLTAGKYHFYNNCAVEHYGRTLGNPVNTVKDIVKAGGGAGNSVQWKGNNGNTPMWGGWGGGHWMSARDLAHVSQYVLDNHDRLFGTKKIFESGIKGTSVYTKSLADGKFSGDNTRKNQVALTKSMGLQGYSHSFWHVSSGDTKAVYMSGIGTRRALIIPRYNAVVVGIEPGIKSGSKAIPAKMYLDALVNAMR